MTCTPFRFASRSMTSRRRTSIFALALLAAASASCSKDEPTQEQLLNRANEAFAAQKLVEAVRGYREVLRLRPDDPVAQRQLGIIYFDQGQLQQAFPLLKK